MKFPLRFRLRTLLIAVAIAGLACGGWTWVRNRRDRLISLALEHRSLSVGHGVRSLLPMPLPPGSPAEKVSANDVATQEAKRQGRLSDWHEALAEKYEHAARYPWLPVPPDPPMPE